jgi:DnaK suppressor protein
MPDKSKAKKKALPPKPAPKPRAAVKPLVAEPQRAEEAPLKKSAPDRGPRYQALHRMLMTKRQETMNEMEGVLGRSLTEDQQRRLEAAMDVGDQALMDLERELGISLMEMRNKRRQAIEDALGKLEEGTYGICEECEIEISEKRLAAVPFAKFCVECQAKQELLEKISRGEERD